MKIVERRKMSFDYPDRFTEAAGISCLEVEDMIVVAERGVVEGVKYADAQGHGVVVRGFPHDHPSEQRKVLYEDERGELFTCSIQYFVTRFRLEGQR